VGRGVFRVVILLCFAVLAFGACGSVGSQEQGQGAIKTEQTNTAKTKKVSTTAKTQATRQPTTASEDTTTERAAPATPIFPDPSLHPGATNPDVTQESINSTICKSGFTKTIRPATPLGLCLPYLVGSPPTHQSPPYSKRAPLQIRVSPTQPSGEAEGGYSYVSLEIGYRLLGSLASIKCIAARMVYSPSLPAQPPLFPLRF
jgi:hypothetical protein